VRSYLKPHYRRVGSQAFPNALPPKGLLYFSSIATRRCACHWSGPVSQYCQRQSTSLAPLHIAQRVHDLARITSQKYLFLPCLPHFTKTRLPYSTHLRIMLVSKEQGLSLVGPPVTAIAREHSSNPG
jgi:hypothetical protein